MKIKRKKLLLLFCKACIKELPEEVPLECKYLELPEFKGKCPHYEFFKKALEESKVKAISLIKLWEIKDLCKNRRALEHPCFGCPYDDKKGGCKAYNKYIANKKPGQPIAPRDWNLPLKGDKKNED